MRKILYIVTAAVLFIGCQTEERLRSGETGEICFSANIGDVVPTRALATIDFATYGIDVAGYHTVGKFAEAVAANQAQVFPNIFDYSKTDNQIPVPHVEINNSGRFVLKTVKWPLDQTSYLSYFAWTQSAPKSTTSGIVDATKDDTTTGYPWIDVVNVDNPTNQVDVAAARHVDDKNYRVISAVDLEFKHILSKLSFIFKSSSGANVEFTKMDLKYADNQVRNSGRYTFNTDPADSIGHFSNLTGYHAGTFSLSKSPIASGREVQQGEMLLLPQSVKKGFLTIDLTYTIAIGELKYTYNKTVDLPATELKEGGNHIYMIDIYGEEIMVHNAAVSDWTPDATPRLPFVPGPMGDTQLLLDGYDKPYLHTDGKLYWLDRSGYNRHVEITGSNLASVYDETLHGYVFDGSTTLLKAPYSIGTVTALSMDIVLSTGSYSQKDNTLFNFSSNTGHSPIFFGKYVRGNYMQTMNHYFDAGGISESSGGGRISYMLSGSLEMYPRQIVTYQRENGGQQQLYRNAGVIGDIKAHSYSYGSVSIGDMGLKFNGKIYYIKLTSKMRELKDIVKSYQSCRIKYDIPIITTYLPPVQNGLMFCFDARRFPKTVGTTKYWPDEIGKNDAQFVGTVNYNDAADAADKFYSVNNNKGVNYMKMLYTVNMHNDFTAEFILRQDAIQIGSPIYWGIPEVGDGVNQRYLYMHIPYTNSMFYVDSPGRDRYSFAWPYGGTNYFNEKRKIVIRRQNGKSEVYMYNKLVGSGVASTDMSTLECTVMNFGGQDWGGEFYAIRYYDRALNSAEMKANYDYDKTTFNLVER